MTSGSGCIGRTVSVAAHKTPTSLVTRGKWEVSSLQDGPEGWDR